MAKPERQAARPGPGRRRTNGARGRGAAAGPVSPVVEPREALWVCALAWAIPGAGHLWLGRRTKGLVFLVVLLLMFGLGLWLDGGLASFDLTQPLVALAALADLGIGVPYLIVRAFGGGAGNVVAATYEYGNSFFIVSGLLNLLVVIDVFDIALGRK